MIVLMAGFSAAIVDSNSSVSPDDVGSPSGAVVDRYMDISTDASDEDICNGSIGFTVENQ